MTGGAAITPAVEAQIWNMPLAKVICYCAARATQSPFSSLDLMSEEEEQAAEILRGLDNG